MKRIFALICLALITIVSASAQKKEVLALTEELNALKTQNVELQTQIDQLTAIAESNKLFAEQLKTMVAAYQDLESSYKSNSEQVVAITTKIDELIASMQSDEEVATEEVEQTPQYEIDGDVNCGLIRIRQGVYYGFINPEGKIIIAPKYEKVTHFDRNRAFFKLNDKWGIIDNTGKVILAAQYDSIEEFDNNNIARFTLNGKYGLVNINGKVIASAQYDKIWSYDYDDGYYEAEKGAYEYAVYTDGRVQSW
ncbi:MAG: WG repeat-containing protein [Alistipes sp.]|nr:WG repeat-containing protein [Alistipes sp.]